jgi:hypothetical protein
VALLAQIVFLTPQAALVGFAFVAPLAVLAIRERAGRRVRAELSLRRPGLVHLLARPFGLVVLAALVALAAGQPTVRATDSATVRSDAEVYLTFDVSLSMLAANGPHGVKRLERARALGNTVSAELRDVPTGVATLTNRMMPLLFPTGDDRGVTAVLNHSLSIMQPQPVKYTAIRASSLATLSLAADRSYFNPSAKKRVLVVFSDLDSDFFSLEGTLRLLRKHHIEPFLVRVAAPGERIYNKAGRPYSYVSVSTVTVDGLRRAHWHAFEENQTAQLVSSIRSYLGHGPVGKSGRVETQRNLAPLLGLAALALTALLTFPALRAGLLARA